MSKPIFAYLKGLLSVTEEATTTALARAISELAHDSLTRVLTRTMIDWQKLLQSMAVRTFGKLSPGEGWLIIDDTVIEKVFAKAMQGLSFVYSSKKKRSVLGYNIVLLAWSNGTITIPLGIRLWQKGKGQSKYDLALEMLAFAKETLKIQPKFVVFDAWYCSRLILKTLHQWGWIFVTQLKKNRKFNGVPLKLLHRNPYWMERGMLPGKIKVLVARHGSKYFVTNDEFISKEDLLSRYGKRWAIEDVFRFLHNRLGLGECQARTIQAQTAHFHLVLMAHLLVERERILTGKSRYKIKRAYSSLEHQRLNFPLLWALCQGA